MKQSLKQQVLKAISKLGKDDIVQEAVYKCTNDGMVCFNGMVAELVNGCKYDPDNARMSLEDEYYEADKDQYISDTRSELLERGLKGEELEDEIETAIENFSDQYDYGNYDLENELSGIISDSITNDLHEIYENSNTISDINDVHVAWCNRQIDFDIAAAEFEEIITNNE